MHANHFSLSLFHLLRQELHHMQRMQTKSLLCPSFEQDREQPTFVNSYNWFQLAATAFSSLSPACCWAAHWIWLVATASSYLQPHSFACCWAVHWFQLVATGRNCFQLLAKIFTRLLFELSTSFNWLQLLPTWFSYLQKLSVCFSSLQFFYVWTAAHILWIFSTFWSS